MKLLSELDDFFFPFHQYFQTHTKSKETETRRVSVTLTQPAMAVTFQQKMGREACAAPHNINPKHKYVQRGFCGAIKS